MNILYKSKPYIILSIILFLFQAIYHHFSHGLFSIYLAGAFLCPLILGILFAIFKEKYFSASDSQDILFITGLSFLTVGISLKGILDIADTHSSYLIVYLGVSTLCFLMFFFSCCFKKR